MRPVPPSIVSEVSINADMIGAGGKGQAQPADSESET
jgi:hypothetical protein